MTSEQVSPEQRTLKDYLLQRGRVTPLGRWLVGVAEAIGVDEQKNLQTETRGGELSVELTEARVKVNSIWGAAVEAAKDRKAYEEIDPQDNVALKERKRFIDVINYGEGWLGEREENLVAQVGVDRNGLKAVREAMQKALKAEDIHTRSGGALFDEISLPASEDFVRDVGALALVMYQRRSVGSNDAPSLESQLHGSIAGLGAPSVLWQIREKRRSSLFDSANSMLERGALMSASTEGVEASAKIMTLGVVASRWLDQCVDTYLANHKDYPSWDDANKASLRRGMIGVVGVDKLASFQEKDWIRYGDRTFQDLESLVRSGEIGRVKKIMEQGFEDKPGELLGRVETARAQLNGLGDEIGGDKKRIQREIEELQRQLQAVGERETRAAELLAGVVSLHKDVAILREQGGRVREAKAMLIELGQEGGLAPMMTLEPGIMTEGGKAKPEEFGQLQKTWEVMMRVYGLDMGKLTGDDQAKMVALKQGLDAGLLLVAGMPELASTVFVKVHADLLALIGEARLGQGRELIRLMNSPQAGVEIPEELQQRVDTFLAGVASLQPVGPRSALPRI